MSEPIIIANGSHEIRIYRTQSKGRPLFQACYYRGGKRERKSFTDLPTAKRECRLILGQLASEVSDLPPVTTSDVESYGIARKLLAPTGLPLHSVVEMFVHEHQRLKGVPLSEAVSFYLRMNDPEIPRLKIRELVARFIESRIRGGVASETLRNHRRILERRFCAAFGECYIPDLHVAQIDRWLGESTWGPLARNIVRKMLVTLANWGKEQGYLSKNLTSAFEKATVYRVVKKPVGIFTPEQIAIFLNVAQPPLLPYLAIAAFAGMRSAEIERLDWRHIHLERGFIEAAADMTKTKRRRLIPISDNLRAWLELYRRDSGPVVSYLNLHASFANLCRRANQKWSQNALRHSYISYRLALIHDTARVALECGNSPDVIFAHYRELVTTEAATAWFEVRPPADYREQLERLRKSTLRGKRPPQLAAA